MTEEVKLIKGHNKEIPILSGIQKHDNSSLYVITMKNWLAPYDTGVSQQVTLKMVNAKDEYDLDAVWVNIYRLSGDVDSWLRLNRRFLNGLRKQFLLWRTMEVEAKAVFNKEGNKRISLTVSETDSSDTFLENS